MTDPFDPTTLLGEGWCLLVTDMPVDATLELMGVADERDLPDGLGQASTRLANGADDGVLLLAKQVRPGRTLVLELDGLTGWVGMDPDLLAELSAGNGVSCAAFTDPNNVEVLTSFNGEPVTSLNPRSLRRWGAENTDYISALTALTSPDDHLSPTQRTILAIQAATNVRLTPQDVTDPWTGGLVELP
ncbi:hypothetical protein [Actinokineospora globicatena]|uniref:Uncharacterized protein n=1 Tax=Actinokineospora globicatena TaxID=103729 RepID=A0A9W6QJ45_9PSEU|nr:hypothetical protein [Actinokineospora globicatena]GLW90630.1 hypothetical protein Aglo03_14460 [Actinokineospora globicatena]